MSRILGGSGGSVVVDEDINARPREAECDGAPDTNASTRHDPDSST
jgi:hypothetical protein